jgi:TatD DNase family protein
VHDATQCLCETHAHLDDRQFDPDREEVIQRAVEAGVQRIITVGTSLESSRAAIALAERYPAVYAVVGVHPHDAETVDHAALQAVRELAMHPRVVAIGEIGLDFYRDWAPRDAQRAAFQEQLALADEVNKPVVIHIRDQRGENHAYEEVMAALSAWLAERSEVPGSGPGVLHCFSGELETAQRAIDLGFYIGVDGPVTYPNAAALQARIGQLPLERLLLETDCPYLTPQPRRGRRNEPAYLPFIAQKVAELQRVGVGEVTAVTTGSACRLFGLPCDPGRE